MRPVRTAEADVVYRGPTPGIGDLHCQRVEPGRIRSVWWLSPSERSAIAEGANIALEVLGEPIPPVALAVTFDQGVGEDHPDLLTRVAILRGDRG